MGKSAASVSQWLGKPKRVAALFNGAVFDGKQVVRPAELEPAVGESHILDEDKNKKKMEIHKFRDVTMRWKNEMILMILAVENQKKVHYGMPVRVMNYDGQSYEQQMKLIWNSLSDEEKKKVTQEEFLSEFRKKDRIYPVITLVFYYGTEEWDGNMDLYDMFQFQNSFEEWDIIREFVPNYKINLVDAARLEEVERFGTELQKIFGLLKCRGDKEAILTYANEHKEYFQHMDKETGLMIGELLQSESIVKKMKKSTVKGEEMDMCKALDDLYNDGVEHGIERGVEVGERRQLKELVRTLYQKGKSVEEITELFDKSMELICELVSEIEAEKSV